MGNNPKVLVATKALLAALAIAQVGDILTTQAALAHGADLVEANPVMRQLMQWWGGYWWIWKAGLGVFFLAYAIRLRHATALRLGLVAALAKVYLLVVVSNLLLAL